MKGDHVAAVVEGDRLALARLLTRIENEADGSQDALKTLYRHTGNAYLIGITGAGGTGKSTLVNCLVQSIRQGYQSKNGFVQQRVAVIAVDPSSPFSGGALLGDRLRMRDLAGDPGVFIRSLATRGARGGLARAAAYMVQAFDAAGFEIIIIETVGAGQNEVDIAGLAHTVVVVEAPGLGDDIQANKAGLMEIADILVVNKSDRPGADQTQKTLRLMIELSSDQMSAADWIHHRDDMPDNAAQQAPAWTPPVVQTIATRVGGAEKLLEAYLQHRQYIEETGERWQRDRERLKRLFDDTLKQSVFSSWRSELPESAYKEAVEAVWNRSLAPQAAAAQLLEKNPLHRT